MFVKKGNVLAYTIELGIVTMLIVSSTVFAYSVNFSPEEVWTKNISTELGDIKSVTSSIDTNGDGLAEFLVEMENLTADTYSLEVLNGIDGKQISLGNFTDVGYSGNGDTVSMDPSVWGVIIEDATGTPVKEKDFMIFANHSNNKRISIYSLDYPSLGTVTYRGIDIPSTITINGIPATVSSYTYSFHIFSLPNNDVQLLYMGYYSGQAYGQVVSKLQIIAMNETLNIMWERNETGYQSGGYPTIGTDILSFNGAGVNGTYPTLMLINLTYSSGNTTVFAIDPATGHEIWNSTVPGFYIISNSLKAFSPISSYMFDYNKDNKTDFMISTLISKGNKTHLNFINSSGVFMGYYDTRLGNLTVLPYHTDVKTGVFHRLISSVDFNGDGNGEILIVDNNTNLICWDVVNNATLWSDNIVNQSYYYQPYLSTGDINGDGVWDFYLVGKNDTSVNGQDVANVNITAISGKDGTAIYRNIYNGLVSGYSGTVMVKEVTDINGDGIQDSAVASGYYNDGSGVYINVSAISMKDGTSLWNASVSTGLNNNDYENWTTTIAPTGDIDGDGVNDVIVKMTYMTNSTVQNATYIRILSGVDGTLLWTGEIIGDKRDTSVTVFKPISVETGWNQFDYNGDGKINEMVLFATHSVYVYAVTGSQVPEFATIAPVIAGLTLLITVFYRKNQRK